MTRVQRVLVIDDDALVRRLVRKGLEGLDVTVIEAGSGAEGLALAAKESPDLILLDISMPGMDGFEVARAIRDDPLLASTPFMFITGATGRGELRKGFELGAVDYIAKPFEMVELSLRVRSVLRTQATQRALETLASTDELTGLLNRPAFIRAVSCSLERLRRDRTQQAALLIVDVDRFHLVNDAFGHAAGDDLLRAVAHRLHSAVRAGGRRAGPRDAVARMGSDEFCLLLEGIADDQTAEQVAQRLVDELSAPLVVGGNRVSVTISVGLRIIEDPCVSCDELLANASAALSLVQEAGGGRVRVYDEAMRQSGADRLRMEADLRVALDAEQFQLHYQPIVCLRTGRVHALEALLRWRHPERGLVPPLEFIPIAEQTGLIIRIGDWAIREACRQSVAFEKTVGSAQVPPIAVNLSKVQLTHDDLIGRVRSILREHQLPPSRLKLEVTESVVMHDTRAIVPVLEDLRSAGIALAMDDFGTGYSSLAMLQRFPVQMLKIDRDFIRHMHESRSRTAIVQAIISLGANLSMEVVAEGIELEDHLAQLQALDCAFGQGYLFSPAVPAAQIEPMLRAEHVFHRAAA